MTTEELPLPAWFKYRQGKAEPAGDNCFRLSAPVSETGYIKVRPVGDAWEAGVADATDGPDVAATGPRFANEADAWKAAFELFRSVKIY